MSELFVVMVNDRHCDPEPELFTTAGQAIAYARSEAEQYARTPEDVDETPIEGWLYHASWGPESDSIWVLAKTVHEEAP
jgi:formylmethanofuran dehydrogenase subunit E-like metal-binding protein